MRIKPVALSDEQHCRLLSVKGEIAGLCIKSRDWKVETFLDRGFIQTDPQIYQWFEEELYDTTEAVYCGIIKVIGLFRQELVSSGISHTDADRVTNGLYEYALWCVHHDWW